MNTDSYNNIKGIIFDLDGTLYHMKWFMRPIMTLLAIPDIFLLPRYMKVRKKYVDKDMGSGENLLRSIAKDLGNEQKVYKWLTIKFYNSFLNTLRLMQNSRPGLNEVLSGIKGKNIKIAVLSDYAKVEERLNILKIETDPIDMMISSESEGYLKPGKGPFLKIADTLNIKPENILVVGDRDDTDGIAAEKCGMQFLKITDKKNGDGRNWDETKSILNNL